MALDRWIALFFLIISLVYGYAAYNYPLLPFERGMVFLPNTQPMALSVLGVIIALVILFSPKPSGDDADMAGADLAQIRQFKFGRALGLVAAMVLYALLLRPVGFLTATSLFIAGSAAVLGERKFHILVPIALVTAVAIWYLVQETLGIYLRPWPWFVDG
jgi:putative tricarboxylic transport membrane protein